MVAYALQQILHIKKSTGAFSFATCVLDKHFMIKTTVNINDNL